MKNSTAFILLLISAGLFYTFIMPQYAKVKELRAQAASYRSVLDSATEVAQRRDELSLKYQALPKDEIANLEKILPEGVDIVELAINLDTIASKYGISVKGIKVGSDRENNTTSVVSTQSGPYKKVTVSFDFVASYDNMRKFLKDLETNMRIIDVRSLSFTAAENGLNDYRVTADTYWIAPQPVTGAPDAAVNTQPQ